ncbi:ATP-dependent RNA helicase MSS116 precursor, partial [Flammula alnicola]
MKESTARPPRRRAPYDAAKKAMSSTSNGPRHHAPAPPARVATPPLAIPVPTDSMRFADLGKDKLLNPILLQTITEDLKFDHMMPVQAATLHDLLEKRIDCLAQAKTGTGKTIAFLLPAIQTMLNKNRRPGSGVSLLVISPTRELAMQIAKEATALLQRLPKYKVCFAIGGTNKDKEERDILSGCDILIATPGRLYDHLSDNRIKAMFTTLDTLVLDEADRLLDMGFMNSLKDIIRCLPDKAQSHRQGMLFSATIAPHVQKFAHLVLADGYKFISTIPKGEINTHERVPQLLVTVPSFSDVAPALVAALREECAAIGTANFKAIVFAPTAAQVDWYAAILSSLPASSSAANHPVLPPVSILHSRVSQSKRTNVSNAFRDATSSILVATDVIARGMDFPHVSTVFQVGVASDKESYIHRLGRTARAGREGRAVLIVTEPETFFPKRTLREIAFESYAPSISESVTSEIRGIASSLEASTKNKTYQAWLGYYKAHARAMGWSDERLWAPEVPPLQKMTVGKWGSGVSRGAPRGGGEGRSAGGGNSGRGGGMDG